MSPSVTARFALLKLLRPSTLKALAEQRVAEVLLKEISQARRRVSELERRFPSAEPRELAHRLAEGKKTLAGMIGGVTGIFGLAAIPADLLVMSWLELSLLAEIATAYKINLKSEHARQELLDVYGVSPGVGSLKRAGPKVLGNIASKAFQLGGWKAVGRAVPFVAAPVSAYFNNQHMQGLAEHAIRHYEGFGKARKKRKISR